MININTPLNDVSKLKAGDDILLSGIIATARDRAHEYLINNKVDLQTNVIYHCGPIAKDKKIVSAGPTTSYRMNNMQKKVIEKYGLKGVIGKGGMDTNIFSDCIYLAALGGGGAILANSILRVKKVLMLKEFGGAEAIWILEVRNFPVKVAIDIKGNNLYDRIKERSSIKYNQLIK